MADCKMAVSTCCFMTEQVCRYIQAVGFSQNADGIIVYGSYHLYQNHVLPFFEAFHDICYAGSH